MAELDIPAELNRWAADHALLCTYEFDAPFFERYCLEKLNALKTNNNVSVLVDASTYGNLASAPAGELPQSANVRYLFQPVRVARTFHPKVFLFANSRRGLLLVGSANLTRPGLTRNAELVQGFRFEIDKNEQHARLFAEAFSFFKLLHLISPSEHLASNLDAVQRDCPWIVNDTDTGQHRLIHNIERPLLDQLRSGVDRPVERLLVVSPFFDQTAKLLTTVREQLGPREVRIHTQNGTTTMTHSWLATRDETVDCEVYLSDFGSPHRQRLHGKGLALVHKKGVRVAIGSANFTSAALASTSSTGNLETMVYVDLPVSSAKSIGDLFDPLGTATPATRENLQSREQDSEPDESDAVAPPVSLLEVALVGKRLTCRAKVDGDRTGVKRLVLNFVDTAEVSLPIRVVDSHFEAIPGDDLARLTDGGACVARIQYTHEGETGLSNPVFLTNLRDIRTGRGQRRERHIREAQHSAVLFLAVLNDLLKNDSAGALMAFLTHCDIRGEYGRRASLFDGRALPDIRQTLRVLGERHLRQFLQLDDAAFDFVQRHIGRLQRHAKTPKIGGLVNYLHIATATSRVIEAQVARAVFALENHDGPVSNMEWGAVRVKLNKYYSALDEVLELTSRRFMPRVRSRYKRSNFAEVAAPELSSLVQSYESLVASRDQLERVRSLGLTVSVDGVRTVRADFFPQDVFSPARWSRYSKNVADLARSLV